ncbi:DUF308 domain-containing protein [Gordonia sp. PP30]|uniref:HdeD family acid-resistance protein n=1 Tax=Gordonia sp. PP30 TaxID=2935861 RepID=UPI001FFEEE96|nr:DUF308 domain-containing protein [Gordonia sp. PP30]UQE74100.1 DUF308 domain-containing protein [Gordonia sp. PP30]
MQSESQGDDHGVPPDRRAWAARGILAATTGVAGIVLLFADLSLPVFVGLAGAGLLGVGLVTLASTGDPAGARSAPTWPAVATGAVCLVAGLVVLFWRAASLHTLVLVLAAALIVHGATAIVRAFRGGTDLRVAGFFSGAAAVVFGVLAVSWPLITVTVFRIGFGAWLVFFAVRVLAEPGLSGRRRPASRPGVRRWARTLGAVVAFLLAVVLAGGSALLLHGDDRPAPGAFYTPPASVPGEPGALIRAESRPGAAPPGTQMWRILYTTTRLDGGPTVASGTVIAPARRGAGPLPLLTVAHGTSGIVPRCAPSLTAEPFADGAQAAVLDMVTQHGWAAVSSDYTGLGTAGLHPYLIGEAEARSVLDASRAAARIDTLRLAPRR